MLEQPTRTICTSYQGKHDGTIVLTSEWHTEQYIAKTNFAPNHTRVTLRIKKKEANEWWKQTAWCSGWHVIRIINPLSLTLLSEISGTIQLELSGLTAGR